MMKPGMMRSSSAALLIKPTNTDDRMAGFSVIDSDESSPKSDADDTVTLTQVLKADQLAQ